MEKKASESPMFHYWKMLIQILISIFIQSERERDFALHVEVLKSIMKYIFAFNHYSYGRWLTIHVDHMVKLELVCPSFSKLSSKTLKNLFFYFNEIRNLFEENRLVIIVTQKHALLIYWKEMRKSTKSFTNIAS